NNNNNNNDDNEDEKMNVEKFLQIKKKERENKKNRNDKKKKRKYAKKKSRRPRNNRRISRAMGFSDSDEDSEERDQKRGHSDSEEEEEEEEEDDEGDEDYENTVNNKDNKDDNKKRHEYIFISRNIRSVLRMARIEFQWIVSQQRMNLIKFFFFKKKKKREFGTFLTTQKESMALLISICHKQSKEWLAQYFPFLLELLTPTPLDIRLAFVRQHCYAEVQKINSEKEEAKVLFASDCFRDRERERQYVMNAKIKEDRISVIYDHAIPSKSSHNNCISSIVHYNISSSNSNSNFINSKSINCNFNSISYKSESITCKSSIGGSKAQYKCKCKCKYKYKYKYKYKCQCK
ncbi:hypothetical protein RFI_05849, partial [Reticulomyxa filosa]